MYSRKQWNQAGMRFISSQPEWVRQGTWPKRIGRHVERIHKVHPNKRPDQVLREAHDQVVDEKLGQDRKRATLRIIESRGVKS